MRMPGFTAEDSLQRRTATEQYRAAPAERGVASALVTPAQSYDVYGRCINNCIRFGGGAFGCSLFCLRG